MYQSWRMKFIGLAKPGFHIGANQAPKPSDLSTRQDSELEIATNCVLMNLEPLGGFANSHDLWGGLLSFFSHARIMTLDRDELQRCTPAQFAVIPTF
jgi:hypothetical protein